MLFNLELKIAVLSTILYDLEADEKESCLPYSGTFLVRLSDAINETLGIAECQLNDSSTFLLKGEELSTIALYSRTHHGLTWYMSHKYLIDTQLPSSMADLQTTNECIEQYNKFWNNDAHQDLFLQQKYNDNPNLLLKNREEDLVFLAQNFPLCGSKYMIKYYPSSLLQLTIPNSSSPAKFNFVGTPPKKSQNAKEEDPILNVLNYKPGTTEWLQWKDVAFLFGIDPLKKYHLVNRKELQERCKIAGTIETWKAVPNTQDSAILLNYLRNSKYEVPPNFWSRYNSELQKSNHVL